MKRLLYLLLVSSLFLGSAVALSAQPSPEYTTATELQQLIDSGTTEYLLIDVRTEQEYQSGHIPTAVNIPYTRIVEEVPAEDTDDLIIVYCRSGARSGRALEMLEEAGYTNAYNFGGIIQWTGETVVPQQGESDQ